MGTSFSIPDSSIPASIASSFDSPLCSSLTPSLFHSRLKTYLFHKSFPVVSLLPGLPSRAVSSELPGFCFCFFSLFLRFLVPCARSSQPFRQLLSTREYSILYRIVSCRIVITQGFSFSDIKQGSRQSCSRYRPASFRGQEWGLRLMSSLLETRRPSPLVTGFVNTLTIPHYTTS